MQGKDRDSEVRDFRHKLKLNERNYFMIVVKAFAKNGSWDDVAEFVKMKKPPIPF